MKNSKDFIKGTGAAVFANIDEQFNYEFVWSVREDNEPHERLKSYAEWLKKSLPDYIDATLEKYLHLISDSDE